MCLDLESGAGLVPDRLGMVKERGSSLKLRKCGAEKNVISQIASTCRKDETRQDSWPQTTAEFGDAIYWVIN